jgi:hypothetical protein
MRFGWLCRGILAAFALIYAAALVVYAIESIGLFEAAPGGAPGAFLLPLGSPWSRTIPHMPEALAPVMKALAPAINLGIFWFLCSGRRRRGA